MSATMERARATHRQSAVVLPEPLHAWAALLLCGDLVLCVLVGTAAFALMHTYAAWIVPVMIPVVSMLSGRYRDSIAVYARDEYYAAITVALFVMCIVAIVALVVQPSRVVVLASLVQTLVWALGAGAWAAYLLRLRRQERLVQADTSHIAHEPRDGVVRRVADVVLSIVGLAIFSPVMFLVALAIRLDDGAPVLFAQERVGRGGRSFTMFKFRTMRRDAGSAWVRPGDGRITRLGAFLRRTSLDELPQLWNVLRGEMSLVGPRPEMRSYADHFVELEPHYEQRHVVAPGITGWAQLYLPRNLQPSDMPLVLRYDLFYVANAHLSTYVVCLVKTVLEVLMHRAV